MKYRAVIISIFLLFAVIAKAEVKQVRLAQFGQSKFLLYLPLYVAMEAGFLKDEGIEVSLVFAGNDDQTFATIASGTTQFAVGDPIFTAIAAERGFRAKTVALMIEKLALYGYTNRKELNPISDPNELSSLRVGSFPSPSTTFTLLSRLNGGIKPPMKIVQGAHGTQLGLLTSNQVDIALDLEPTVSIAEAAGNRVVLDLARFTEPAAITGLMTSQKVIDQDPALVKGFVAALQRALRLIDTDRAKIISIAQGLFPDLDPQVIERAVDRLRLSGCYPKRVNIPEQHWKISQQIRVERGDLQKIQPLEMAVDNRFASGAQ
jgi:NitT/TauT family transport system substrate-binding protein